jgi:hypothetical protein
LGGIKSSRFLALAELERSIARDPKINRNVAIKVREIT